MLNNKLLALSLIFLLVTPFFALAEESITITTYYPSPYGSYREMRAKRMAIGDGYINGQTYSWDEYQDDPFHNIDYNADLVVEGNVGIGTTSPGDALEILGQDKAISLVYGGGGANNLYGGRWRVHDTGSGVYTSFDTKNSGAWTNDRVTILSATGNVGIGTTGPSQRLTVYKSTAGDLASFGGNSVNVPIYLHLSGDSSLNYIGGNVYYNGTNMTIDYTDRDSGFIKFSPGSGGPMVSLGYVTAGTNPRTENLVLTVNNVGNVGIGTTSPSQKLDLGNSGRIVNVQEPVNNQDVATKHYVDAAGGGIVAYRFQGWHASPCTTVTGTTCRARISRWDSGLLFINACDAAPDGIIDASVCFYSSQ